MLCRGKEGLSAFMGGHCTQLTCVCLCCRGGAPCVLSCQTGSRFLTNFSLAGVGVASSSPRQHSYMHAFCWWFIAPSLPSPLTSQDLPAFLSLQNQHQESALNIFNITLQFSSNYTNHQDQGSLFTPCCSDRLLVYDGVPNSILPISLYDSLVLSTGKLLAAYSGTELRRSSLSVNSSLLTVVYYSYSRASSGEGGAGFQASVMARRGEGPQQEAEGGSGLMEVCILFMLFVLL